MLLSWNDSRTAVDRLWTLHTRQLTRDHRETEDPLACVGSAGSQHGRGSSNEWKDRIRRQGIFAEGTASPIPAPQAGDGLLVRALVLAGGERAADLPSRDEFLNEDLAGAYGGLCVPLDKSRPRGTSSARSTPNTRATWRRRS